MEEGSSIKGMGLLNVKTVLSNEKTRSQNNGKLGEIKGIFEGLSCLEYEGYEIHMGLDNNKETLISTDDNVYGTYIHGIFDKGEIAEMIIKSLLRKKGKDAEVSKMSDYRDYKETQYDKMADILRQHLNMKEIYELLG